MTLPRVFAALLLCACSKPSASASPAPLAPPASVAATASLAPSSPPVPAPAASRPPLDGPCELASGYRGTVADQPVFARLGKGGRGVHGRYFYERVGTDIALDGTLSTAGALVLSETSGGKVTGRFEGTCDGAGVLAGTWKAGAKSAPFELAPIPRGDVPVIATKRYAYSSPVKGGGPADAKTCSYKEAWDEVFGLRNPAAERALNGQGLEVRFGPRVDPADAKDVFECGSALEVEMTRSVSTGSFRELTTVRQGGYLMQDLAPHPTNFLGFDVQTVDLRSGLPVTSEQVFARDPMDLVRSCIAKQWKEPDVTVDMVEQYFGGAFELTENGAHFYGNGFPHFMGVYTGQGPTIAYGVLLREGLLKTTSPVARAWSGVSPAAKDVDACDGPAWPAP